MSAATSHTHSQVGTQENKNNPQESSATSSAAENTGEPREDREMMGDRQLEPAPERAQTSEGGDAPKPRRPRGFAAMDRKLVSEIARKGGKAAHSAGTAHEFTTEEARIAGRKGGRATHAKRRAKVDGDVTSSPPSHHVEGEERH